MNTYTFNDAAYMVNEFQSQTIERIGEIEHPVLSQSIPAYYISKLTEKVYLELTKRLQESQSQPISITMKCDQNAARITPTMTDSKPTSWTFTAVSQPLSTTASNLMDIAVHIVNYEQLSQAIQQFAKEERIWYEFYTTFNDDNLYHADNAFFNHHFDETQPDMIHLANIEWVREILEHHVTPEELLNEMPNAKPYLEEFQGPFS